MDNARMIWDTVLFYINIFVGYVAEGAQYISRYIYSYFISVIIPSLPPVLKFFSNRTTNMILFFVITGYIVIMNIVTLCMFGADKGKAKKSKNRVSERRLIKMCFFGGAVGGFIGMYLFHHKTKKAKFFLSVPLMFIIQIVLQSFIIGFLAFWAFFY